MKFPTILHPPQFSQGSGPDIGVWPVFQLAKP